MKEYQHYHIGTPGEKWQNAEKQQWLAEQSIKRSYQDEVITKLQNLDDTFIIEQYGSLPHDQNKYPLFFVSTRNIDTNKPNILITGGVHGYETSGVQGAIRFLTTVAKEYLEYFNIFIAPCVSPWGYETINRWNPNTHDPNRSFYPDSPVEEASLLMQKLKELNLSFKMHIDLHETTDTDNSEFRPALAARDAIHQDHWDIPDGFYIVGNSENRQPEFQLAVIESVKQVTHIAPANESGIIIGESVEQDGVIYYDVHKLHLCTSITDAKYVTTTEVYPDSELTDDENCIVAQVAAVVGGLNYVKDN